MTDPTPTRAEVEAIDRAIDRLRGLNDYAGRPAWDEVVREELGASILALRERAEAAEKDAHYWKSNYNGLIHMAQKHEMALYAARRTEAAAWNDAIEAAAEKADAETGWSGKPHMSAMQYGPGIGARIARDIRALRRAAPTEGEA